MREQIRDFVKVAAYSIRLPDPVYEFGAFQVAGQEYLANLRPLFPGMIYVGCDMREGPGVDRILNLHDIDLPGSTVGTVLCLDTLEHVEYPYQAMGEIHRILRPDGIAIISSVMNYPIHDFPSDYWRFTPEAFRLLLKAFRYSFVTYAGQDSFPHTVIGVGFKGDADQRTTFEAKALEWKRRWTELEPSTDLLSKIQREALRISRQLSQCFNKNV